MRLLVRCDGAPAIGMGHVVRCASLAQAVREQGGAVEFAMRAARPEGTRVIHDAGFSVHRIANESDAIQLAKSYDVVLIDSYEVDAATLARYASQTILAVIDDDAGRDLRAARWILNQNLGAQELAHNASPKAARLFGPSYALLRPEFARERARLCRTFDPLQRQVLISFGGGDVSKYFTQLLEALDLAKEKLQIVLLGVEHSPASSRHHVRAIRAQEGVAALMAAADVAITAAGTTAWELSCMQTPAFAIPIAENQRIVAEGLQKAGAMRVYPSFHAALLSVSDDLIELLRDAVQRRELSKRAGGLVDGLGAQRAAQSLSALTERS